MTRIVRSKKMRMLPATSVQIGSAWDAIGCEKREAFVLELGFQLSRAVKRCRMVSNLTQNDLAKILDTSQPRVNAMEGNGTGVSLESLFKALVALGTTKEELGRIIIDMPYP